MTRAIIRFILLCAAQGCAKRRVRDGPAGRRPPVKGVSLALRDPVEAEVVVGALHDLDLVGDAPRQRLLVQRQIGRLLVLSYVVGLANEFVALRLVWLAPDLGDQRIDFFVAVAADIRAAAIAGIVAAAGEGLEDTEAA